MGERKEEGRETPFSFSANSAEWVEFSAENAEWVRFSAENAELDVKFASLV